MRTPPKKEGPPPLGVFGTFPKGDLCGVFSLLVSSGVLSEDFRDLGKIYTVYKKVNKSILPQKQVLKSYFHNQLLLTCA